MGNAMIRRLQDETGATMAEYALMVSFVAIAALLAVQAFGGSVLGLFQSAVDLMP
jgi:Flp pilus assembly pilin Flp